jgi:dTDP-4-dehydrorhamnose reductase
VVAAAARSVGARTVHISTDVVFAGDRADGEVYVEADPVGPVHDYGRAKADAERRVVAADPDAVVVRTSLLYAGVRVPPPPLGRHEQAVLEVLDGRRDMAFFTDEWRAPITVTDLASVVVALALATDPSVAGVHHVAGPEAVSRHDLARRLAAFWGRDPGIIPGAASASATGRRPRCCVLASTRPRPKGAPAPRSVTEVLGRAPLEPGFGRRGFAGPWLGG